jgi:hypothetical protein
MSRCTGDFTTQIQDQSNIRERQRKKKKKKERALVGMRETGSKQTNLQHRFASPLQCPLVNKIIYDGRYGHRVAHANHESASD